MRAAHGKFGMAVCSISIRWHGCCLDTVRQGTEQPWKEANGDSDEVVLRANSKAYSNTQQFLGIFDMSPYILTNLQSDDNEYDRF